ncbi:MAG TPA: hypothetical protein VJN18_33990 [Polyangiaceae bacterium]|nr:hypothetical protein [Polyangiaceae bacterium]
MNFVWQCLLAIRTSKGWHSDALARVDPIRWSVRRLQALLSRRTKAADVTTPG